MHRVQSYCVSILECIRYWPGKVAAIYCLVSPDRVTVRLQLFGLVGMVNASEMDTFGLFQKDGRNPSDLLKRHLSLRNLQQSHMILGLR
jgi:hypothetical protein